jgi:hypothetical protein
MRSIALVLLTLALAVTASAQEVRYRLERIVVEGSKIPEEIVRAEARLEEERSYTEAQFREAVYRIRRLPFVVDATYRIASGIGAGTSTLVIRIVDETPVFYAVDAAEERGQDGETANDVDAVLGGRLLLDDLGVVEATLGTTPNDDGAAFGVTYRAYDLAGTGAFASASAAIRFGAEARRYDPVLIVTLGWPLTQRQTLILRGGKGKSRFLHDFDVNGDDNDDPSDDRTDKDDNVSLTDRDGAAAADLRWDYESIDDPLFATHGMALSAGTRWSRSTFLVAGYDPVKKEVTADRTATGEYGLVADAALFRPLPGRNVGVLRFSGDAVRVNPADTPTVPQRVRLHVFNGVVHAGLGHDLHTWNESAPRPVRARFELSAGYRLSLQRQEGITLNRENDRLATAAFTLRHRWGTMRLTGTYLWE